MAKEIILPKFGNSVEECILTTWLKKTGDTIKVGEMFCEVETDKTNMEVESTDSGTILHQFYDEGDVVPVLQTLVIVGDSGEDISDLVNLPSNQKNIIHDSSTSTDKSESPTNTITNNNVQMNTPNSKDPAVTKIFCSPRARAYLANRGLHVDQFLSHFPVADFFNGKSFLEEKDIKNYFNKIAISNDALEFLIREDKKLTINTGSGIGGRILKEDIISLPKREKILSNNSIPTLEMKSEIKGMDKVVENSSDPMMSMRKIIADRMMHSLQTTAQLTLNMQASASNIKQARAQFKSDGKSITINDIILYIISDVLQHNVWANSLLGDNRVVSYKNINLGFAVQTPKGLMVPVISNTEEMSLEDISSLTKSLSKECREGSITAEKLQGGTFTVSNLGAYGIQSFTPILNAPQTGILGVGSIDIRAIETTAGTYEFEPCFTLSFTFDHRAYDGAKAAELLRDISDAMATFKYLKTTVEE